MLSSITFVLVISLIPVAYAQSTIILTASNITQTTTGPSTATVTYTVTVLRDGTAIPSGQVSCTPSSGSSFNASDTAVTCSFQDSSGQQVNLQFKIKVDTTAPTVTATPLQGSYNTAQSVTLASNEPVTTMYYTTDGSVPTTASPQYSSPISISTTTTLKFFGRDSFGNSGSIVTETYTIDTIAPTVTASPTGGLYNTPQSVTLTPSETAAIYYTTDGTIPTTSSTQYSAPIAIPSGITLLNYFAKDIAGNEGTVATQTYTIDTIAPTVTASPTGGLYNTPQSVTLAANEPATIYYTVDGSTPTTGSTPYTGSLIPISINTMLKFFAQDTAGNTAAVATETYSLTGTSAASATGAGTVSFSTNAGSFASISSISESSLPTSGKPTGLTFEYGFFSWTVTGLTAGQSMTMTITYPAAIIANTQYWTVIGGTWANVTPLVGSNDGDNVLILTITDGGLGDEDGLANGQISDPGGSATIIDTIPPSITAPADITQEAIGPLTTIGSLGTPIVSDDIDPSPTVTNNAPPGGFPVGTTTVTWTAIDDPGNSATAAQSVTITDTTPPTMTPPSNLSIEATGQLTPVGLGSPSVSDLVDVDPTITNNAPPGGFPVGATTVTWTATDDSGNSATATQTVTITDTTAPSITAPSSITQEATAPLTGVGLGSATASDIADPSPTITNNAPPGGFPVGTTTVVWTATDDSGNSASDEQSVTILDTTAPTVTAPVDIITEATGLFTSVVLGTPTTSDLADPTVTVTNNAPSGGFPVGATLVTWTATDDSGNSATATQTVTITDTAAPSIAAPPNISTAATGEFTTVSLGLPTTNDAADPTLTVNNDSPSGGFPVGTIIVTWTATDDSGNSATDTQVVTVTDTGAPSITAPADITQEATANLSSVTLGIPIVSDDEDPTPAITNDAPSGGFPVGATLVTWTATDDSGNSATAAQSVTITDSTPPSISAPAHIIQEASSQLTSVTLGSATANDIADPSPTITNNAPSGGFPVGITTVTWTAMDDSGNTATAAQTVTITDTTAPTITAPADITQEATSELTTLANGSPITSDLADPSLTVTNDAPPGGFTVGATTVTWTATDDSGNSASATQLITIADTTPPSITAPAGVTLEATAPLTPVTLGTPTTSDLADPTVTVTNDAPSGGFPVGATIVTWTATDDSGNSASATQLITITDTGAPSITPPAGVTIEAIDPLSIVDIGIPTVSDSADPSPTVTNDAPAGGFPVGTTVVTWTATDDSGNSATASQTITVTDTSAPAISAPVDISQEATNEFTSVSLGTPVVSDAADSSPTITNDAPPGGFPVGTTTVTWTAADDSGNSAADTQLVTVTDSGAPSIIAPADLIQEATGPLTPVTLGTPTTSDLADPTVSVSNDAPASGFPVGITTVTWTAADDSGNSATATQTVTITDTTPPSITAPADITQEATSELTALAIGSPTVSDLVDASPTITNNAPSGGFPVGTTTVTWTAMDDSGNSASATQIVTITDTTAPSITAPLDVNAEASAPLSSIDIGSPTVSDLADSAPSVTNDAPATGFSVGTITVTWTATDISGNSATATQIITIIDTITPSIAAPGDITTEATGILSSPALGIPTVSDIADSTVTVTNDAPAAGFPVGATIVTWTATDDSGNSATATQTVTITDTTAPTITAPADISAAATGEFTIVTQGSATVNDVADPSPLVTNDAPSGGFPVGTTIVTWTVTDASSNTASDTQLVTITDNGAPSITVPADIIQEASAPLTSVILGAPTVSDDEDPSPTVTNDAPAAGFPVGATIVTWTATDDSGNSATATQTVTITDTTPPSITAPADITQEATGEFSIVILGSPAANDLADPSPTITNNAPSGGFPVGITTVTWTATDGSGNSVTDTQTVTITDTTAPSITAPAGVTLEATAPLTPVTLGTPTTSDLADPTVTVTNNAPSGGFPVGATIVTWTATDDSGNSATATQTVTLVDTTAPSLAAPADVSTEATGLLTNIGLGTPTVSDIADSSPSVTNNAPAAGFPVGTTTVTWTATDDSGNSATDTQIVTITDTGAPSITAPADITQEATGGLTPVGLGSPIVSDDEDPSPVVTNDASAAGFPIGATIVTWTATDDSGNSATAAQTVTITDTTPPTVTASPVGGIYGSAQGVILTPSDLASASVTIYYTTNGDTPTISSNAYSGTPIAISSDTTLKFYGIDSSGNSGTIVTETYTLTGTEVDSATGTGVILLTTSEGSFQSVSAISESSLPAEGKPAGLTFEHGFVSFTITDITPGSSITLTITYPSSIPADSQYWKVIAGTWVDLTSRVGSNNGDNVITLTLTDGGLGDEDGVVNGEISDPSGSGYIVDVTAPTLLASPAGAVYSAAQSVMLSSNEAGTEIYYTTNGATPTTSSTLYTGVPISVGIDTTLKFFGVDSSGNNSPVSTEIYDINPAPAIVMQDTTSTTGQSLYSGRQVFAEYVTSSSTLVGKQIDSITIALKESGTAPGTAQIGIINQDLSIKKLFATLTASSLSGSYVDYEFKLPAGDVYTIQAGDRVGIKYTGSTSSSGNNISIMRDTNTADPFDGTNSHLTVYTSSWAMTGTTLNYDLKMTLKYSGGASGGGSDTTPPIVTASPVGGSYNSPKLVTLTSNEPATIYYTTNGVDPTTSSPIYSGSPLSIATTTTLKFFGKDVANNSGAVQTQAYTIDNIAPTVSASPGAGSYTSIQSVTLTANEPAIIYYTTNGNDPEPTSPVYASSIQLSTDTTLKFYAKDTAGNFGSIVTEQYTITIPDTTPPTATAAPTGATFGPAGTTVTLATDEPASIYYTINGDIPDTSSSTYSTPITISTSTTLKFFALDAAGNPSNIITEVYTIDNIGPTVSASPPGGTYTSIQSVTLSSSESGTVIRYTTNGDDPTGSSPQYTSPISITTDITLKTMGTDNFGNPGSILTEIYDINAPSQPPGIVMEDTTANTGRSIFSSRPVYAEYVSSSSVLVGKQIDSITVGLKKSDSSATGTAYIGIINSDLSMKKVFATLDISTLTTTSYAPREFILPSGETNYIIEAGDRIGVKYTGGTSSSNYIAIMRDLTTSDPFDGANTHLTYYEGSWVTSGQTQYDLTMTLKLID